MTNDQNLQQKHFATHPMIAWLIKSIHNSPFLECLLTKILDEWETKKENEGRKRFQKI